MVMVDDSHAVGFVGTHGRGTPEHCGVEGRVDIITGTLGKALGGASGGYTVGPARGRRLAAPALAALSLLQHADAGDRRRLAEGLRPGRDGRRRCAQRLVRQRRALPRRDDEARLHAGRRRPSDHPGHARRRRAGAGDGREDAGARHLRHRLLLPGRAARARRASARRCRPRIRPTTSTARSRRLPRSGGSWG